MAKDKQPKETEAQVKIRMVFVDGFLAGQSHAKGENSSFDLAKYHAEPNYFWGVFYKNFQF
jgi:hypothetical protein